MNHLVYVKNYHFGTIDYSFKIYKLNNDVISCIEAANEKGISLKNELKSLVLKTSSGLCLVNVSGENQISLRKIKRALGTKEAFLLEIDELKELNLIPGTVCPFLKQLWNIKFLIDYRLLELSFLSTNNGQRNQFIIFQPQLLLLSKDYMIGDFIK